MCVEEFDLTTNDFSQLSILENGAKTACNVKSKDGRILYKSFILDRNSRTIIKCDITFYRSSVDNRYIPRLIFRKCNLDASEQESTKQSVRIAFDNSNLAKRFWGLINFLSAFKDLVDTGSFEKEFKVVTEDYAGLLNSLDSKEKITAIKRLLRSTRFSQDEINSLVYESRRQVVRRFLWLLRNKKLTNGESSREYYKRIKCLSGGDETIWHHFLRAVSYTHLTLPTMAVV